MTEQPDHFEIKGSQYDLSDGRSVWAGKHDDSWYIQFVGPAGTTRLRLSFEAAVALVRLLDPPEKSTMEVVARWVLDAVQEKQDSPAAFPNTEPPTP